MKKQESKKQPGMPHVHSHASGNDLLYYNLASNGSPLIGAGASATPATIDMQRTTAIIGDPSEFYCAIVRATIPLSLVPIAVIPHIGATDVTPYVIGIRFGAAYFTSSPLVWVPELYNEESIRLDLRYHMRSYGSWVSMINTAMAIAYAAFSAANPGAPQAIAAQAPFCYFDATADTFKWVNHNSWNTPAPASVTLGAAQARVTVNSALLSKFDGWRMMYPNDTVNVERYADYVWENDGSNAYTLNGLLNSSLQTPGVDQVEYLSSLRRLVITSSNLPVAQEGVPTTGAINSSTATNAQSSQIVDFIPQLTTGGDSRSIAYYLPDAMWTLKDLVTTEPINRLSFAFWWADQEGVTYPILLAKGAQASLKIAFVRRGLFNNDQ